MASSGRAYIREYMRSYRARWVAAGLTTGGKERMPYGHHRCRRCGIVSSIPVCGACQQEVAA